MSMSDGDTGSAEWGLNLSGCRCEINGESKVRAPEPSREHEGTSCRVWSDNLHSCLLKSKRTHASSKQTNLLSGSFDVANDNDKHLQQRIVKASIPTK